MNIVAFFASLISSLFMWLVLAYRVFRPLLGSTSCCRFPVSCSEFALLQLKTKPLGCAVMAICKRVCKCHPFHKVTD